MGSAPVRLEIRFDRFAELKREMRDRVSLAVRKAAFDVLAHTQTNLWEGHGVDTGNLKNSYRVDSPNNIFRFTPGATEAVVGTQVEYAVYVEFGTRKMAPIAHLGPAVEAVKPSFIAALRGMLR